VSSRRKRSIKDAVATIEANGYTARPLRPPEPAAIGEGVSRLAPAQCHRDRPPPSAEVGQVHIKNHDPRDVTGRLSARAFMESAPIEGIPQGGIVVQ
jgi:hypothetical protein